MNVIISEAICLLGLVELIRASSFFNVIIFVYKSLPELFWPFYIFIPGSNNIICPEISTFSSVKSIFSIGHS